jgi:hypothetical protein
VSVSNDTSGCCSGLRRCRRQRSLETSARSEAVRRRCYKGDQQLKLAVRPALFVPTLYPYSTSWHRASPHLWGIWGAGANCAIIAYMLIPSFARRTLHAQMKAIKRYRLGPIKALSLRKGRICRPNGIVPAAFGALCAVSALFSDCRIAVHAHRT